MFCVLAVAEENAVLIAEHLVEILRMSLLMFSVIFQTTSGAIPILVNLLSDGNVEVWERVS